MMRSVLRFFLMLVVMISSLGITVPVDAQSGPVQVVRSDESIIRLSFQSPQPQVTVTGSTARVDVSGADGVVSDPGSPNLPYYSVLVGIPTEGNVQVDLRSGDGQTLTLPRAVERASVPEDAPETAVFESKPFPGVVTVGEPAWMRGQRLVRVSFFPFQPTADANRLAWYTDIQVDLRFEPQTTAETTTASEPEAFENLLRDSLINYSSARAWRGTPEMRTLPDIDPAPNQMKIVVDHDGLYQASYADLTTAGWDLSVVDPHMLQMSNQGDAVAYWFTGDEDTLFEEGEALVFYGQKLRGDRLAELYAPEASQWIDFPRDFSPQFTPAQVEEYTDENVYWLKVGTSAGLWMQTAPSAPAGAEVPAAFRNTVRIEKNEYVNSYHFTSEETWFWYRIVNTDAIRFYGTIPHPYAAGEQPVVRGEIVAQTHNVIYNPDHLDRISINGMAIIQDALWDGPNRFVFEGAVPNAALNHGSNYITFQQMPAYDGQLPDKILFNWYEVEYDRQFIADDNQLTFTSSAGTWQFETSGFTDAQVYALDITDPLQPLWITEGTLTSGVFAFEDTQTSGHTYFLTGSAQLETPKSMTPYTPPADFISGGAGADYVIITHADFLEAVQPLADYRATQGYRVKVVDVADIYNVFNYGIFHSMAIKNFLEYIYTNWTSPAPTYILLVGDGNWNFKDQDGTSGPYEFSPTYMPPHLSWVDPYIGQAESTNLLGAVAGNDILSEYMLGRFPVNTAEEATAAVNKTIAYEQAGTGLDWQQHMLFIADNIPDAAGDFIALSNQFIEENVHSPYIADKIYMNDLGCSPQDLSGACPQATEAIVDYLNNDGALFVSYTGHGDNERWAAERIFATEHIPQLLNGTRLPVVLSMTCKDGIWQAPNAEDTGLAESLVRADNSGAVATFSPTGLGLTAGHDLLENGFFKTIFTDRKVTLGEAANGAKAEVFKTGFYDDLIHTFLVTGDPALHLPVILDTTHSLFLPLIAK